MNGKNSTLKNVTGLFRNARTRTIILLTAGILLFAVMVGFFRLSSAPPGPQSAGSLRTNPSIQSIPGGFNQAESPEYARLQEQQNAQEARIAARTGSSSVPTIIRSGELGAGPQPPGCCIPCGCPPSGTGKSACGNIVGQASLLHPGTLAYDVQGRVIGTLGPDGKVRDPNNSVIGTVGPDGLVRDVNNMVLGGAGAAASGTQVFNGQSQLIGTVGPDGKIRDASGNVIGTICPDGIARDLNGNAIGKAASPFSGSPVYDAQGHLIGTVGPDGKVRDANGNVIGTVDPDGTVRDLSGNVIGKTGPAVSGATPVYDAQGHLIGYAGPDGKVRDANGRIIGTVGADGVVHDLNGKVIGKVGPPGAKTTAGIPIYDSQGRLIGIEGADGKVRDKNGRIIGTVGPNGLVPDDATGKLVGKAGSIVPGTPVYDAQGHLIGTVGPDGLVRDANGNVIGKVGPDGVVRDANGNIIGKTGPNITGTPIYDSQGRLIGIEGADGKVRDASGKVIGTVGPDGVVRDANGNVIGSTNASGATLPPPGTGAGLLPGAVPSIPNAASQAQQMQAIQERQARMISQQQADQERTQTQSLMAGQAGQLIAAWVSPSQQYVAGSKPTIPGGPGGAYPGGPFGNGAGAIQGEPSVKAGTVMFGVILTSINSDEPGPVLGQIVVGKFRGGKIIGSITNEGQKVLLTFNTLNLPGLPVTISINAVAIDQCTARTAFSSCTDNHYLMRYGSLFAAAFLQGYGQAFQTSGQTVISTGLATATTTPVLSPTGKFLVALGNVGTRYSSVLGNLFNTPPTVHVYSGTAMGLLFLSDVPPLPTTSTVVPGMLPAPPGTTVITR